MKTWNFGIVGAGLIADFHAKAISDIPNANLVGFCDGGSGHARELAKKFMCRRFSSYQELVKSREINVVTIATPSGFHMEPDLAAATEGKHVICEKPLEITLERIDVMIEAHKKSGTLLGGIFQNRFNDCLVPLREAVNHKRFGKITYAAVFVPWWRSDAYYRDSWHGTWKLDGGGALMNQSIHAIDLLIYLAGRIESLQAYTATLGHDIEAEDTSVASVRFAGGALGIIYGTTASYPGQLRRLEITGTKGTAVMTEDSLSVWQFTEETKDDKKTRDRFSKAQSPGGASDPAAISYQNHTKNFRAFIESLETGKDFCLNGKEARKAVEVILAIYKSAREQKIVKL